MLKAALWWTYGRDAIVDLLVEDATDAADGALGRNLPDVQARTRAACRGALAGRHELAVRMERNAHDVVVVAVVEGLPVRAHDGWFERRAREHIGKEGGGQLISRWSRVVKALAGVLSGAGVLEDGEAGGAEEQPPVGQREEVG